MAPDKKTYLRDATKMVQKGQLDKAIAAYKSVLKIDPNDVKVHNALGDLFIRRNMKREGINEYVWVADYYEKDGFHLRSIAMCQKILNLDKEMVTIQLKLGDLYAQQKLLVEAKRQYLKVADFYEKKKKVSEALEVFSKIADLDPGNVQVRVKLAANYEKQGLPSKAAAAYARAAEGCIKSKEADKAAELLGRAVQFAPEDAGVRRVLAELQASREQWPEVVRTLRPLLEEEHVDVPVLKTYAAACLKTSDFEGAIGSLEKAMEKEPSSVPLKTLLGRAYLQGGRFEDAFALLSPLISGYVKEERLEAAGDLAGELVAADPGSDRAQQKLLEILQLKGDREGSGAICVTLAGIYESKGRADDAVAALEKALELDPGNAEAAAGLERLRGPAEAEEPAETEPEAAPAEVPPEEMEVEMFDLEGEDLPDLAAIAPEAEAPEEGAVETTVETAAADFEESLGEEEEEIVIEPEEVEAALESEEPPSIELPATEAMAAAAVEALDEQPEVPPVPAEEPAGAAKRPAEAAEEIGEEIVAGIAEEAVDEIVEEVDLEGGDLFSSEEVSSLVEEGVLDAGPGAPEPPAAEERDVAAYAAAEPDESRPDTGTLDIDLEALVEAEEVAAAPERVSPAAGALSEEMEEFLAEGDFYLQEGLLDEAEFLYRKLSKLDPGNEAIDGRLQRLEEIKAEAAGEKQKLIADDEIAALESDLDRALGEEPKHPPAPAVGQGRKVSVRSEGSGGMDEEFSEFLSDLRGDLEPETPEPAAPEPEAVVDSEESLSAIFQDFQEGLKEQLGEEDFETHYNLGIAYKEMGLLQEALGEFVLAEKSQARRLDSVSMLALCLREMGRDEEAVGKLREGLDLAAEGSEAGKGFLYDLADLCAHLGREGESKALFERLYGLDREYRDVAERTGRKAEGTPAPDPSRDEDPQARSKKSRVSYL